MENSLGLTLLITAIGMSLLFLSLVLFYGIISLLTAVTGERPSTHSGSADSATGSVAGIDVSALQAAAIAIALARAAAEGGAGGPILPGASDRDVTTWWSLHHQHRLAEAGKPRRLG